MPGRKSHRSFIREACLDPRLLMLGSTTLGQAVPDWLHAHDHGPAFEICLIRRGVAHWWVGDEVHELTAGSLYVTGPGERHGTVDDLGDPMSISWAIIDPTASSDPAWQALTAMFLRQRPRSCPASADTINRFDRLMTEHECRDPLSPALVGALLVELLVQVLRDGAGRDHGTPRLSPAIRGVLGWLHAHVDEDVGIPDLAGLAGLGPAAFHARFRQETGFAPNEYRIRLRVQRGRELLATTRQRVTAIALHLGFPSSQYFATVFKKQTGLTPQAWRRRHRG